MRRRAILIERLFDPRHLSFSRDIARRGENKDATISCSIGVANKDDTILDKDAVGQCIVVFNFLDVPSPLLVRLRICLPLLQCSPIIDAVAVVLNVGQNARCQARRRSSHQEDRRHGWTLRVLGGKARVREGHINTRAGQEEKKPPVRAAVLLPQQSWRRHPQWVRTWMRSKHSCSSIGLG